MQLDLLIPVFVQAALTFVLLFRMASVRIGSIKSKDVAMKDIAVAPENFPAEARKVANAYHNQHELPTLFYAVIAFCLIFQQSDFVVVILAWVFVLSRLWHAWVHTTSNYVPTRFNAFAVGVFSLMALWAYLGFKLLTA